MYITSILVLYVLKNIFEMNFHNLHKVIDSFYLYELFPEDMSYTFVNSTIEDKILLSYIVIVF